MSQLPILHTCPNRSGKVCLIATRLSDIECKPTREQCNACSTHPSSPQGINGIVCAIAYHQQKQLGLEPDEKLLRCITGEQVYGPGEQLQVLLMKYESIDCGCEERIQQMNDWGVEGCRENQEIIVEWIFQAAIKFNPKLGWPLVRRVVKNKIRKLVENAIESASKPMQALGKENR